MTANTMSNIQTQGLAYALPVLGVAFLTGPLTILQGIYATHFGLALTTIATVLLVSRLFDAVSDPLIGYLSDQYYARYGSRKPFVISGGVLFILSSWFLYVPPDNVSTVYFLGWFLAFYLCYTLFYIPHLAWGSELSGNSQEKNTIYSWRAAGDFLGALLFFAVPLLPIFETNAFTPETLQWSVFLAGCLMLPMLYLCVTKVPNKRNNEALKDHNINHFKSSCQKKESLGDLLSSILGNPSLLWFLAAFFSAGTGVGMWFAMVYLFADSFLGLGQQLAWMFVISYGVGSVTMGLWAKLATYWGKQRVWGLAMLTIGIGLVGMGWLTPGEVSQLPLLLCMIMIYSGFAAWIILAPSLLADIIDYGTWKFGRDRAGTYFSLYTLIMKTNYAIGGALGLGIAGGYGFDASATAHSTEVVFGLHLAMVWIPVPMVLLSIVFMAFIPINSRRHAIIRRCLDVRVVRDSKHRSQKTEYNRKMCKQLNPIG